MARLPPSHTDSVARYLAAYSQTLATSTLRHRLATIASWHRDHGLVGPTRSPLVRKVLKGSQTLHQGQVKLAAPLQIRRLVELDDWFAAAISAAHVRGEGAAALRHERDRALVRHYLADNRMYSDLAADSAVRCDELTQGQLIARLAAMYDELYIDEVQDLAGYDLDLVKRLLKSDIAITLVGDTRQATYATNYASRHSQYRGPNLAALFQIWASDGLCQHDHRLISLRCVQILCDLADALYPQIPRTESGNGEVTAHDGIYLVAPGHVAAYMEEFAPNVLRHDRRQACDGPPAVNFGHCKGRTYSRVLIFPNGPLTLYLRMADASRITAPPKHYVALTRARQSVAFRRMSTAGSSALCAGQRRCIEPRAAITSSGVH